MTCPCCGEFTYIDGEEMGITIDNVKFPVHFHHSSVETGAVKISEEEIKKDIRRAIEYFRQNKEGSWWYTSHGALFLTVFRFDGDEEYSVMVTEDFYETSIPFEEVDYNPNYVDED